MRSAALLLAIALAGCIPVKKTYVTWPGRTVRVKDGKGAIAAAKLAIVRVEHPYSREVETRTFTTDEAGEVKLVEEKTTKTVMPLMMHGVPQYSFRACAEAAGHASATKEWWDAGASPIELTLARGSRPCEAPKDAPPPDEKLRLEGIEEKDGSWIVDLATTSEPKLAKESVLSHGESKLTVREVLFRSPKDSKFRRFQVRASGDGSSWKYGDLIEP